MYCSPLKLKKTESVLCTKSVKVGLEVVEPVTTKSVEGVVVVPKKNLEVAMHTPNPHDVSVASVDLSEGVVSPAKKKQRICGMKRIIMERSLLMKP